MPRAYVFILIVFCSFIGIAKASESDDLVSPFAIADIAYDSNFFRLSGDDEAKLKLGTTDTDDTYLQVGGGLKADLPISRQLIQFDGLIFRSVFSNFDYMDYTGGYGDLNWKWRFARRWKGDIGYDYSRNLVNYSEVRTTDLDLRTDKIGRVSARFGFNPNWSIGAGVKSIDKTHSDVQRRVLNKEIQATRLDARYSSRTDSSVAIYTRFEDVFYPERDMSVLPLDNGYLDTVLGIEGMLAINEYSSFNARIEYLQRDQNHLVENDFNDVLGRVDYDIALTSVFELEMSLWREIDPLDDVLATRVFENGFEVVPIWLISSTTALQAKLEYRNRDYADNDVTVIDREDKVATVGLAAKYTPSNLAELELAWEGERRSSNIPTAEYTYHTLSLSGRIYF